MEKRVRQVVDIAVAIVNLPVTIATAALNKATGATVRFDKHYTVVCDGGWLSNKGMSSIFTTGNTFNVKSGNEHKLHESDALFEHEWRHSVQWAIVGPIKFTILYALNYFGSERIAGSQVWNVFEWTANFQDGGYTNCATLGKHVEDPLR